MIPVSVWVAVVLFVSTSQAPPAGPRAVVMRAIEALGGDAALKSVRTLQIESIGHEFFIDQSERPEGPFVTVYVQASEKRDVSRGRSRLELQRRFTQVPEWSGAGAAVIVDEEAAAMTRGERYAPAGRDAFDDGRERLELAPERVLFTALDAVDLAAAADTRVHGVTQRVVTFGWRGRKARLLIDAGDFVPTALELTAEDSYGIWGAVRQTAYYSLWTLIPGGVRYPLQIDREWNGVPKGSSTIMKIAVNQAIDEKEFTITPDAKAAFAKLPTASRFSLLKLDPAQRVEVEPGKIAQYGGNWNVAFVQQPDGLVVIEAPIGSHYSVQVLEEAAKRYPGVKVKAVITTSDAWPHLGGVREYVARGIAVYALDLNQPILERLLKADYSAHPDALAKAPKAARFTWVSGKTVIGTGETRIELFPIRGENGERMMMAYFPALELLYSSDEIMRQRAGEFFMPELLLEVKQAIAREGLAVDRIFGFHIGPTPWSEIEAAIKAAS